MYAPQPVVIILPGYKGGLWAYFKTGHPNEQKMKFKIEPWKWLNYIQKGLIDQIPKFQVKIFRFDSVINVRSWGKILVENMLIFATFLGFLPYLEKINDGRMFLVITKA